MSNQTNPFHAGELEAQRRAGVEDIAASSRGFIRGHMPDQHRAFFAALPFLVITAGDTEGRPWVSILEGPEGFASSPGPGILKLDASLAADDPLADSLVPDRPVGLLGIELATRRRNRLNGRLTATTGGYTVAVSQSFGNCPQYIHEREWHRAETAAVRSRTSGRLDDAQAERIAAVDTFFIGSGHRTERHGAANGFDASHRGGPPGFVRVEDGGALLFPDYPGNNFFNTIRPNRRIPSRGNIEHRAPNVMTVRAASLVNAASKFQFGPRMVDGSVSNARRGSSAGFRK
ncbi:pyridoxamine 5'-phosphate oxidase family protein [Salipiger mucosus]|uniref:Putative iron-sulfur binding protein n=1 Tax=Salipiger mucosus DSM 16094 TaxID=1123237 RepID=S9QX33_9RHOB|nr:pyridoxamine 5'-phosphate oxidase family protein [Salipiger mucosus]EPX84112.1 putative iron-sulfur binding protein [Salipiger mucosus DSM 16094]